MEEELNDSQRSLMRRELMLSVKSKPHQAHNEEWTLDMLMRRSRVTGRWH